MYGVDGKAGVERDMGAKGEADAKEDVDTRGEADAKGEADAIPKGHTVNRVPTFSPDKSGLVSGALSIAFVGICNWLSIFVSVGA